MRAIHLLRKLDPSQWGGTETALQRLCEGLRGQGVEPIVYCPALEEPGRLGDPFVESGYSVQRYRAFVPVLGMSRERKRQLVSSGGNLMSFDLLSSLMAEEDISVMHTHTLGRIGGIALTVARKRQLPFVVTIHGGALDLPAEMKKSFSAPADRGWEWGKLFGALFKSHRLFVDADAILACNETEANLLRERLPEKRIQVQPHGVDVSLYEVDHRAAAYEAFPVTQGRDVLVSVGRIDPIKNQEWLVKQAPQIFAKYPCACMVLVGACTDEPYGRRIEKLIKESQLQGRVLTTGGLSAGDPRLLGLFQVAQALLLPSISETFGLVILEAWAAGTAVLSSRTSGATSLIRHGENGLIFELEEPETFHQGLGRLLRDPQLASSMAERGAELVKRDFNTRALAGRMKALYEEVIEEKQCAT